MTFYSYANRVSFYTPTTGTGTISVGTIALPGYQLPGQTILQSSSLVGYLIIDGTNWEVGTGTYTTGSPSTISRLVVEDSSSGQNVFQNLSGNAIVSIVVTAAEYAWIAPLASPAFTNVTDATIPSLTDNSTKVATSAFAVATLNCIGRNKIHNPMMNIAQRGTGAFTTAVYTLDRWAIALSSDTVSITRAQYTDNNRLSLSDQEANYNLTAAITGSASAGAYSLVWQGIENVRRLSNKTVTVSFWGHATSGTPKVGVGLRQYFGTGGSPSSLVDINATAVTLSTTPTRYSVTVTLPSISGLTLGSNNDHYTRLAFFFSSGATYNTVAGGIGVQTATFVLSGIQLEIASIASQLEKIDQFDDLANCQRFYQIGNFERNGYTSTGILDSTPLLFPVPMRAAPTVSPTFTTQTNCASSTTTGVTANGFSPETTGSSNAVFTLIGSFTATADLAAGSAP